MLKDSDLLTMTCPHCGHKFQEQVGAIKNGGATRCHYCTKNVRYERQAVVDAINNRSGALDDLQRGIDERK